MLQIFLVLHHFLSHVCLQWGFYYSPNTSFSVWERRYFRRVVPHTDVFLIYLWGGRCSPHVTPLPSWRSPRYFRRGEWISSPCCSLSVKSVNSGRQPACWWRGPRLWIQTTWLCHFLALWLRARPFTSQARTQMSAYTGKRKVHSEKWIYDPQWLNTWENSPQWVRIHVCNKLDSISPARISNNCCSNCSKNCWQDTVKSMNSKLLQGIPWQPVVRTAYFHFWGPRFSPCSGN